MIDFADLDEKEFSATKVQHQAQFTCMSCAGTGLYRGYRSHQPESICFACGGKGTHNKPHFEKMADKRAAKAKRVSNAIERRATIKELLEQQEPGLFQFMAENGHWNNFYREMAEQINTGKAMTPNQHTAAVRMRDKIFATRAAKAAEKKAAAESRAVEVDLNTIHAMFNKASEAGLKKLVYRAEGLVLTPAKAHSANAGGIYVKTKGGDYLGKVMGTKFMACREATNEHKEALNIIAANPAEAAAAYGKRTGECSCCGRELTDPNSITIGIGPICAEKWGF